MESAAGEEGGGRDDHIHHHHHHQMRRSRENISNNNNNNNVFVYKECLRNHAASLGSYATDGCGEFTPEDIINLQCTLCAACGCHRNFHRKILLVLESQTAQRQLSESSPAPEISSDRSGGGDGSKKKRVRTKFTEEQKEKMLELAEKVGWKMQRRRDIQKGENGAVDVDEIDQFCKGVGITRQIFKVWMHNHKNSSSSSSSSSASTSSDVLHLTAFNAAAATSLRICTTNTNSNPPTADHQYI